MQQKFCWPVLLKQRDKLNCKNIKLISSQSCDRNK